MYPKPGPTGGKLIREVIGLLRSFDVALPIDSHILIAVSGGSDSVALAHLLVHYGRRVAPRERIALLHINHGWRGKDATVDARFVRDLARKWKVGFILHKGKPPAPGSGESWEDSARKLRKRIYAEESAKQNAVVLTAHQADDLAETLLWRVLTGGAATHGGGIGVRHGVELRPLLKVRKDLLKQYLKEESQAWREDSTNLEGRFLRSRMRLELMPTVESLFPRAIYHLVKLAMASQNQESRTQASTQESLVPLTALFAAAGVGARRPHWEATLGKLKAPGWRGELHFPGGWKLSRRKRDQWVLEQVASGQRRSK